MSHSAEATTTLPDGAIVPVNNLAHIASTMSGHLASMATAMEQIKHIASRCYAEDPTTSKYHCGPHCFDNDEIHVMQTITELEKQMVACWGVLRDLKTKYPAV